MFIRMNVWEFSDLSNVTYYNKCNSMQIFIYCKGILHVSGVTAPIIRSSPDQTTWTGVAVQVVWPVPEAAGTVFNTSDDGCCDTRNM